MGGMDIYCNVALYKRINIYSFFVSLVIKQWIAWIEICEKRRKNRTAHYKLSYIILAIKFKHFLKLVGRNAELDNRFRKS
jgi:hypothetical protein